VDATLLQRKVTTKEVENAWLKDLARRCGQQDIQVQLEEDGGDSTEQS